MYICIYTSQYIYVYIYLDTYRSKSVSTALLAAGSGILDDIFNKLLAEANVSAGLAALLGSHRFARPCSGNQSALGRHRLGNLGGCG